MPRKSSKKGKGKGKGGGGGNDDLKQEEVLQAILLADSFTCTFRPVTRQKPKVLLPLVNVPMLEYTLELLASNNVQEVFVFCCSKAAAVKEYLEASKWNVVPDEDSEPEDVFAAAQVDSRTGVSTGPDIRILTGSAVTSAGDALREIDSMGVIRSKQFILVSGDVISNMNLAAVLEQHKARRKADSTTLMTMVFKKAAINHRTRALDDDLVIAVNADTNQVLRYDDNVGADAVTISRDFVSEHPRVQFRYDMLDCHIYVCSPEVLVHFSDNYDYADIRQDYVHNEVQNAALSWRFFAYFIENEYAARVHDPRTYDSIARDIVARWTYPMVPDTNMVASTHFTRARDGTYKERKVRLARTAVVTGDSVIGARTVVGDGSTVHQSTIGRNCVIGKGCKLDGCYVWDNVVIEDGATVSRSIICNDAVLRAGSSVGRGCIISYGVTVGAGFAVRDFTRLTRVAVHRNTDFDSDAGSLASGESGFGSGAGSAVEELADPSTWDEEHVGAGGAGRLYPAEGESDDEADDGFDSDSSDAGGAGAGAGAGAGQSAAARRWKAVSLAVQTIGGALRGGGDRALPVMHSLLRKVSTVMGADEVVEARAMLWNKQERDSDDEEVKTEAKAESEFTATVRDMLLGGAEEGHDVDAVALEISCYRHAENRTFSDVAAVLTPVMLDMIPVPHDKPSIKAIQTTLSKWGPLVAKFVHGPIDEATVVDAVVHYCTSSPKPLTPFFGVLLLTLYNLDATSADAITQWAAAAATGEDRAAKALLNMPWTQKLLDHLEDDDEDDDEDSDSGSGSDSGSDDGSGSGSGSGDSGSDE